uniref:Uncharacterized protein n=1 Tax=Ananas comosus var. bracteatus TaxID=296719 RepID=A0A6V7Q6K5_ANACO|nr:unnamed protein product [Ananas comosus var. bracteatus]
MDVDMGRSELPSPLIWGFVCSSLLLFIFFLRTPNPSLFFYRTPKLPLLDCRGLDGLAFGQSKSSLLDFIAVGRKGVRPKEVLGRQKSEDLLIVAVASKPFIENPAYARCRDKPFPVYDDMEFLTQNTTATGRYAFTSAVELPPIIESSSGSSPGEDDTIAGIGMSACNLSSDLFEARGSGCTRNANFDEANTSRSPSPPVMPTTGASGSGHSSSSKRARSPESSKKQAQTATTSGGRKKKVDARTSAYLDIAEQGKKKLG